MPYIPSPSAAGVTAPTPNKCPAQGKKCYNCGSQNHYTAFKPSTTPEPDCPDVQAEHPRKRPGQGANYQTAGTDPATTLSRHSSCSQSQSPSPHQSNRSPRCYRRSTPFWYHQDSIKVIQASSPSDSMETSKYPKEGSLLKE